MIKTVCLNVLSYVAISILLMVGAREEWLRGNKIISLLTGFVALMMIWNAVENMKNLNTNS